MQGRLWRLIAFFIHKKCVSLHHSASVTHTANESTGEEIQTEESVSSKMQIYPFLEEHQIYVTERTSKMTSLRR